MALPTTILYCTEVENSIKLVVLNKYASKIHIQVVSNVNADNNLKLFQLRSTHVYTQLVSAGIQYCEGLYLSDFPLTQWRWYCFQQCPFVCLSVCLSVNTIAPEPLQILSRNRNFQGIILWSKGQTSSKMAICRGARVVISGLWCSRSEG